VPNIKNVNPAKSGRPFIEDMARLLMPWGVPQTAAILYGYLLLCPAPASLDQITADLDISKSSASAAARLLEKYTLVRRHGERGSKRALYEASENYQGILSDQQRMLRGMADLLKSGARTAASAAVQKRLDVMAAFYMVTFDAMEKASRQWAARQSK
jgi:DNA-binding transcriptional regulator GbsR (MarR family)